MPNLGKSFLFSLRAAVLLPGAATVATPVLEQHARRATATTATANDGR
jgi:hypothetical protein